MNLMNYFIIIFLFLPVLSYAQISNDLTTVADWLTGSFSSEEQARNDSDYYNVTLEMKRIWDHRKDGIWFYVEQAIAENRDKPYRQRVYRLLIENEKIKSIIYLIPDEKNYTAAYKNTSIFNSLTPEQLELKDGCDVIIFRKDENTFIGSTVDENCSSNLRGAAYATTKVVIKKNSFISWDQGFNENHEQVWGAVKGGYIFKKIQN